MQDLRWDDLRVFLALVREGSLSGAARALGVNHSTAWRRLAALEAAAGAPLFERDGYALTAVGEAALPHAERVEEDIFALRRAVAGTSDSPAGTVRLTAPESMLALLAPILVEFGATWPQIHVELATGDRFFDLDRQEADVAIRPGPQPPDNAVGRRVCAIGWTVYAPASLADEECEKLPWVGYSDALAQLAAVQWRRERQAGEPILTVSTVPAMASILARSTCRGMLPCFVGDAAPDLKRLQPPIPEARSELWLLVHAELRRNARVRLLVDHCWTTLRARATQIEG
jgi:DNA-binding transcriptional LysR family regulator